MQHNQARQTKRLAASRTLAFLRHMSGARPCTIRQANQYITMWSYVPTRGRLLNNDEGAEPEKELVCFVTVAYDVAC